MTQFVARADLVIALSTSGWDQFYGSWVRPAIQFLIPLAIALVVLIAVSGLATRFMVGRDTEAWPRRTRYFWATVGSLSLLTVAVFLPLYPFRPFTGGRWLTWAFMGVVALGVALTVLGSRVRLSLRKDRKHTVFRTAQGLPWPTFWLLLLLWAGILSCFLTWSASKQLLVAYVALTVLGISATSMALGQVLRLQVEAQAEEGKVDAAATDYVLARLKSLGSKEPDGLGVPRASELSKLLSEDLSALRGGAVTAAIARCMYTIRPGLTWRARITLVDMNRVTTSLTRNGLHVNSTVISRMDLGLPAIPADAEGPVLEEEQDRARAQLLTGAAACILVELSRTHPDLKKGLCDAERWKAVALHVIATEPALVSDRELRLKLLQSAVNLEPRYGPSRLDYTVELFTRSPKTLANRMRFVSLMEAQLPLTVAENTVVKPGWEAIRLRILYSSAAMRINVYLMALYAGGQARIDQLRREYGEVLTEADRAANELATKSAYLANAAAGWPVAQLARFMDPAARNLQQAIALLGAAAEERIKGGKAAWNAPTDLDEHPPPRLVYHYAALAQLAEDNKVSRGGQLRDPLDYLAFRIATDQDWTSLWTDPSFWGRLHDPVQAAAAMTALGRKEAGMLDLKPFEAHRKLLAAAGVTTFRQLRLRTETPALQEALASYLSTSIVMVAHLADIADLAATHDDLARAEVLRVFLNNEITSRAELKHRATADPT